MLYLTRQNNRYRLEQRWWDKKRINYDYAAITFDDFDDKESSLQARIDMTTSLLKHKKEMDKKYKRPKN